MHLQLTFSILMLITLTRATTPVPTGGPHLTHEPTIGAFTRLGCYTDSVHARVLNGHGGVHGDSTGQTLDKCAATCTSLGYSLFGVEYGGECWCDSVLASTSSKVADVECTFICPGNVNQYCGAGDRLELYKLTSLIGTKTISSATPSTTSSRISTTLSTSIKSTTSVIPLPSPSPGYYYFRSSNSPNLYLQSSTSDFTLSGPSSTGQFAIYSGAYLTQLLPNGDIYYAQVTNTNTALVTFLNIRWQRYPGDNGIFSLGGPGLLTWVGSGVSRPNAASFWQCEGVAGLRINTRGFEEGGIPAGCVEVFVGALSRV